MAAAASSAAVSLRAQQQQIAVVVASYFVVSIALVFVNKVLMDPANSIDAPLFATWYQCLVTVGICWYVGERGQTAAPGTFFKQFPKFRYDVEVAKKLLPLSLVFVGMITFNNLCLKFVEVSFYNVARSLTIVFNVAFTYWMLGEKTSGRTLACLGIVIAGFFIGSGSEVNFSLIGTVFGVISSAFVSMNAIQTKKVMSLVDGNQWALCAYNNMNAVLMFLPIILVSGELSVLFSEAALPKLFSLMYWTVMTLGGVFGFLIGIVTILQIKVTSPLTHNISGTAKSCVQTVLALFIWRNPTNFWNVMGILMVLLGSAGYSYVRNKEMEAASKAKGAAGGAGGSAGSAAGAKAPSTGGDGSAGGAEAATPVAGSSSSSGIESGSGSSGEEDTSGRATPEGAGFSSTIRAATGSSKRSTSIEGAAVAPASDGSEGEEDVSDERAPLKH